MKSKSKDKINFYHNKPIKRKKISKKMTYNKPLFISIKKESSITKNSSCSTKICSANNESPYETARNNNTNRVYSVRDFDLDNNNYSKTSLNFFSKYINTSVSSNEEYNNNNCETLTQTFTPSRQKDSPFNEDEKEQFTPYLGQKKTNEKNSMDSKKESLNKSFNINNHEKNKYSNIFNHSKKIIESASLNLNSHFDEQLSNKYKIINKFQKLSIYQKKKNSRNKNKSRNNKNDKHDEHKEQTDNKSQSSNIKYKGKSKTMNELTLYRKKSDLSIRRENERKKLEWFYVHNIDISEKDFYENSATLIQTVFRGYILRIKLYNRLKLYTCITVFSQIINNIYIEYNKYYLYYSFHKILQFNKNKNSNILNIYKNSFILEGDENKNKILCSEIKELIDQNNKLQLKLNEVLINNNILKNDLNKYKEFETKYNKLLVQLEKLNTFNNNLIKDNTRLNKQLNEIEYSKKILSDSIQPCKELYLKIQQSYFYKKLCIENNLNAISIISNINNNRINKYNKNKIEKQNSFNLIKNNINKIENKNINRKESNISSHKKENLEKNDNSKNMYKSVRINLRNYIIESQEVNLELEESQLSKEEILKRKKLRNLFKNKLFLLRDITRKYFLRFYYNGIFIKMIGKNKMFSDNNNMISDAKSSQNETRKKRNTSSSVEKGRYLRKLLSQKTKEKSGILKIYFNIFKQNLDIKKIRKKLIFYGKEIKKQNNTKELMEDNLLNNNDDNDENNDPENYIINNQ
jgi:hypothetical protein